MALASVPLLGAAAGVVLLLSSASPSVAAESTVWASPQGSDQNPGTTQAKPVRSLQRALNLATDGQAVRLASGSYPFARDQVARKRPVRVTGYGGPVTVDGLSVSGGQRVTYDGLRFTETVNVGPHPTRKAAQPATDVTFVNDDITSEGKSHCMRISAGSANVSVRASTLHDCRVGIAGGTGTATSTKIDITGNVIKNLISDGIMFGDWSDVTIADNAILDVFDPAGKIHNDAVQITGDVSNVRIQRNYMRGSGGQLVLLQPAAGPVDDVLFENNVLTGAEAVPLQSFGVTRARFVNNTIWSSGLGKGILLRPGRNRDQSLTVPTDTVVSNNIVRSISLDRVKVPAGTGNVTWCPRGRPKAGLPANVSACVVDQPDFVDYANGDLRLRADSPLRNSVDMQPTTAIDQARAARSSRTTPGAYR